jgi:hypothetical protein
MLIGAPRPDRSQTSIAGSHPLTDVTGAVPKKHRDRQTLAQREDSGQTEQGSWQHWHVASFVLNDHCSVVKFQADPADIQ